MVSFPCTVTVGNELTEMVMESVFKQALESVYEISIPLDYIPED